MIAGPAPRFRAHVGGRMLHGSRRRRWNPPIGARRTDGTWAGEHAAAQPHGHHPERGRPGDVGADEHFRHAGEVLHVPDSALDDGDEHPRRQAGAIGRARRSVRVAAGARTPSADGDRQQHGDAVDPRHGGDVESPTADVLVPGVGSGSGDDRAGDEGRPPCSTPISHVKSRSVRRRAAGAPTVGRRVAARARRPARMRSTPSPAGNATARAPDAGRCARRCRRRRRWRAP